MRVQGFRGRGMPRSGVPSRGSGRHYGGDYDQSHSRYEQDRGHYEMTHGRSKPPPGRGSYDTSRGRYSSGHASRYDVGYEGLHQDDRNSRKRVYPAGGGSRYGQGRSGQDGGYYTEHPSVRSRNPPGSSPSWEDDRRHDDRKRMRSSHDNYSEASSSRRHDDSYHYDRSEYQERRGYREEHPRHGDREPGSYYPSTRHEESHRERRESGSRYREAKHLSSPQGRGYMQESYYSRIPAPSHSSRGVGARLRGYGFGMDRGRGSMRILRRGGSTYFRSLRRLSTRDVFPFRPMYSASSQVRKGLLLRRRALDNRRRLLLARNRRLNLKLKEQDDTDEEEEEEAKKTEEDDDDDDDEEEETKEGKEERGEAEVKKTKKKKVKSTVSAVKEPSGEGDSGNVQVTIQQDQEGRAVNKEDGGSNKVAGKKYIQLLCPHCKYKAITFTEYNYHLNGKRHGLAMRSLAIRHKMSLSRMRTKQRLQQRDLEKTKEEDGKLTEKSNFCRFCKLLFRETKQEHQASEMHKLLKKFLLPYCSVCKLSFRAPMLYENHTTSLFHIKRKASKKSGKKEGDESGEGNGETVEPDEEFNPDNFMTLDSVGDVDEEEEKGRGEKTSAEGGKESSSKKETKRQKSSSPEPQIDEEYVQKVEVFYCELCRRYLASVEPLEKIVSRHCLTRAHMINYWLKGDEVKAILQERFAKKHSKETSPEVANEKSKVAKTEDAGKVEKKSSADKKEKSQKADTKKKTEGKEANEKEVVDEHDDDASDEDKELLNDDKLWDDVNKDLGDLLKEVEPGNSSDGTNEQGEMKEVEPGSDGAVEQALDKSADDDDEQDEQVEQERWDRLKTSEKVIVPPGKILEKADKRVLEEDTV